MPPIPNLTAADFLPLWPAVVLSLAGIILLLSEVFLRATEREGENVRTYQAVFTVAVAVLAGALALGLLFEAPRAVFLAFAVLDPFSAFITAVACLGLGLTALLSDGFLRQRQAERGEFYALLPLRHGGDESSGAVE